MESRRPFTYFCVDGGGQAFRRGRDELKRAKFEILQFALTDRPGPGAHQHERLSSVGLHANRGGLDVLVVNAQGLAGLGHPIDGGLVSKEFSEPVILLENVGVDFTSCVLKCPLPTALESSSRVPGSPGGSTGSSGPRCETIMF